MDSYIKFIGHGDFEKKRKGNKLSKKQAMAYRDFQNHFLERIQGIEQQVQQPIQSYLTKKEIVNLYRVHIDKEFSPKEFSEITGMKQSTARKELSNASKQGRLIKVKRGVYKYE